MKSIVRVCMCFCVFVHDKELAAQKEDPLRCETGLGKVLLRSMYAMRV